MVNDGRERFRRVYQPRSAFPLATVLKRGRAKARRAKIRENKFTFLQVWDTNMIETAMKDFYNKDINLMIQAIQMNITEGWSNNIIEWETCPGELLTCPNKFASESIETACDYAYKGVEQDSTLADEYFFSRLPVMEKRIAQAGVSIISNSPVECLGDGMRDNSNWAEEKAKRDRMPGLNLVL
ncbi:Endonuclease 4 [Acorus calamus]|uniref:Aspergillus nuclease S1 n=1 Tax=Acorus calamus TaxID=4465 RepID=A0AAV9DRU5_ACOCL|nr:Endonuclease 4 [Acorus calamus]